MAGRRSYYQEAKQGDVLSLCNDWLLQNFHTFDKATKLRVALAICPKGIKQHVEHSGELSFKASDLQQARSRAFASN